MFATVWFRPSAINLGKLLANSSDESNPSSEQTAAAATNRTDETKAANPASFHKYPVYSPRFWHGMRPVTWFQVLRGGRFRVGLTRIPMAIGIAAAAPFNTALHLIQRLIFGRKLAAAELHGPPVFIVGHWRSGTTLLHELMVRDERLSSPSTFQCFAPHHFLVSEWFFRTFCGWLLPGKRPMDNMDAGWDRPQEDEFALMNLGVPSPYRRMAFPNQPPVYLDYLDFHGVAEEDIDSWIDSLRRFLLAVSTATHRPLIIKSPTHTGRVGWLAKAFPDARFIHITRDPRSLFPSTCRLWKGLDDIQGLQRPRNEHLEEYVVTCLKRMYESFHRQRKGIDSSHLVDVRYEDLIANPVETLRNIYETLRLGDFESVEPIIEQWVETEHRGYKVNQHELPPEQDQLIRSEWREYFETYGYG